jgi:hypothetical protein
LAGCFGNHSFHEESFATITECRDVSILTSTRVPGAALPQTGTGLSRCKTILEQNIFATSNCEKTGKGKRSNMKQRNRISFQIFS